MLYKVVHYGPNKAHDKVIDLKIEYIEARNAEEAVMLKRTISIGAVYSNSKTGGANIPYNQHGTKGIYAEPASEYTKASV